MFRKELNRKTATSLLLAAILVIAGGVLFSQSNLFADGDIGTDNDIIVGGNPDRYDTGGTPARKDEVPTDGATTTNLSSSSAASGGTCGAEAIRLSFSSFMRFFLPAKALAQAPVPGIETDIDSDQICFKVDYYTKSGPTKPDDKFAPLSGATIEIKSRLVGDGKYLQSKSKTTDGAGKAEFLTNAVAITYTPGDVGPNGTLSPEEMRILNESQPIRITITAPGCNTIISEGLIRRFESRYYKVLMGCKA